MPRRRGNLGFGAIASGGLSGPHYSATILTNPDTSGFKFLGYAVLSASPGELYGAVTKLSSYAVLNASIYELTVGVTDFRAYGLYLNLVPTQPPPVPQPERKRFKLGMAEYSHTTGFDAYSLRGQIPSFETFRSQLIDGEPLRYRAVSGVNQETGEGIFDWLGNKIVRVRATTPPEMVDWPYGRKIIHFVEDDGIQLTSPRLNIGIAEFSHTVGLEPYKLLGALREYATLASRLGHGQRVKYRATNNAKEEVSEGVFDTTQNILHRNLTIIPSDPIDWGPGRKLIYITEIF